MSIQAFLLFIIIDLLSDFLIFVIKFIL